MLNKEKMITELASRAENGGAGHEQMFQVRKQLRGLRLTVLAQRFEKETGNDPYALVKQAA